MFTLAQRLEAADRSENDRVVAAVAADLSTLPDQGRPAGADAAPESARVIVVRDRAHPKQNAADSALRHDGFPKLHGT